MIHPLSYYWFRYIRFDSLIFKSAHETETLEIGKSDLVGIYPYKGKFNVIRNGAPETVFKMEYLDAQAIIDNCRSYGGKIGGKAALKGIALDQMSGNNTVYVEEPASSNEEPAAPIVTVKNSKPNIPYPKGQVLLELNPLDKNTLTDINGQQVMLMKPSDSIASLVESASKYLGLKIKINTKNVPICVVEGFSTSLLTTKYRSRSNEVKLLLDLGQLKRLNNGILDTAFLAQVITHELGHYVFGTKLKQSDKLLWKRNLAGRGLHPDQFNHPGYSYGWDNEAFAIMCEYMVSGKSARGLSTTEGWEIVEKYFVNNFLKNGIPTGDKMNLVRK